MRRRPLPAELGQAFSTSAALDAGVHPKRLSASDLKSPFRGVHITDAATELAARCAALRTVLPGSAAFSHGSAARLWGVPLPRALQDEAALHITVPAGAHRVRRAGVVAHYGDRPIELLSGGVPVTTAKTTWCDLSAVMSFEDLVIAGDHLCNAEGIDSATLREALRTHPARRGRVVARSALSAIRTGCASPGETRARLRFASWSLPEPELNVDIHDRWGGWLARVDFLWRMQRVVAEYYGAVHAGSWDRDLTCAAQIEDAGYRVVVLTARDLWAGERDLRTRLSRLLS